MTELMIRPPGSHHLECRNSDGQIHCDSGPAILWDRGCKWWCKDAHLHRVDGPAVESIEFGNEWWINGNNITEHVNIWMEEQNVTWPFDEPTQMMFLMKFC